MQVHNVVHNGKVKIRKEATGILLDAIKLEDEKEIKFYETMGVDAVTRDKAIAAWLKEVGRTDLPLFECGLSRKAFVIGYHRQFLNSIRFNGPSPL